MIGPGKKKDAAAKITDSPKKNRKASPMICSIVFVSLLPQYCATMIDTPDESP